MKRAVGLCSWMMVLPLALAACGDDDDDTTPVDASPPDAVAFDAALPDAGGLCGSEFTLTGDYVDWDSVEADFSGVAFAAFVEVGNETNTATTAPNGRVILCVSPEGDLDLLATEDDYLPMRFSVSLDAERIALFQARGATPARMDQFYGNFWKLTRKSTHATVVVNAPADATVTIDAPFEQSAVHELDPRFRVFGNVTVGAPAGLTVTPPTGQTCSHRDAINLQTDGISYTHVACE